jgi:hypothetical protein
LCPTKSQLERALAIYEAALKPAGTQGVAEVMTHLHLVTVAPSTEGMSELEIRDFTVSQIAAYVTHLGHVPLSILNKAAHKHGDKSKWFPKPAELLEHAAPLLYERTLQRDRLKKLLANIDAPSLERKSTPVETYEERMRASIASYRKIGRHQRANELEEELAKHEGREPVLSVAGDIRPNEGRADRAPVITDVEDTSEQSRLPL